MAEAEWNSGSLTGEPELLNPVPTSLALAAPGGRPVSRKGRDCPHVCQASQLARSADTDLSDEPLLGLLATPESPGLLVKCRFLGLDV